MVKDRNFSGIAPVSASDGTYEDCNFCRPAPIEAGGTRRGVEVFPASPPVTLRRCNLVNVEPPANAVLDECLVILKDFHVVATTCEVTIGDETIAVDQCVDVVYGRYDPTARAWRYFEEPLAIEAH